MTEDSLKKNIEINHKLIQVLEDVLAAGDWEATLFLRTAAKRLERLRAEGEELLALATGEHSTVHDMDELEQKPGYIKVFVALYQAEGNNIKKWLNLVNTLSEHSVGRPIYNEEEAVRAMIRSKPDPTRQAYVEVAIKEESIIQLNGDMVPKDKSGHDLLTLKSGAIHFDNIVEFIHGDKRYGVSYEELVLKTEEASL